MLKWPFTSRTRNTLHSWISNEIISFDQHTISPGGRNPFISRISIFHYMQWKVLKRTPLCYLLYKYVYFDALPVYSIKWREAHNLSPSEWRKKKKKKETFRWSFCIVCLSHSFHDDWSGGNKSGLRSFYRKMYLKRKFWVPRVSKLSLQQTVNWLK